MKLFKKILLVLILFISSTIVAQTYSNEYNTMAFNDTQPENINSVVYHSIDEDKQTSHLLIISQNSTKSFFQRDKIIRKTIEDTDYFVFQVIDSQDKKEYTILINCNEMKEIFIFNKENVLTLFNT